MIYQQLILYLKIEYLRPKYEELDADDKYDDIFINIFIEYKSYVNLITHDIAYVMN